MGWKELKERYKKWDRRLGEENRRKWKKNKPQTRAALKLTVYIGLIIAGAAAALIGFMALIRIWGGA